MPRANVALMGAVLALAFLTQNVNGMRISRDISGAHYKTKNKDTINEGSPCRSVSGLERVTGVPQTLELYEALTRSHNQNVDIESCLNHLASGDERMPARWIENVEHMDDLMSIGSALFDRRLFSSCLEVFKQMSKINLAVLMAHPSKYGIGKNTFFSTHIKESWIKKFPVGALHWCHADSGIQNYWEKDGKALLWGTQLAHLEQLTEKLVARRETKTYVSVRFWRQELVAVNPHVKFALPHFK